jgi:hypothetical protein
MSVRPDLSGFPTSLKFQKIRILLSDGVLTIRLEGDDFSGELCRLECGDSVDLVLPIGGTIPVCFKTD